MEQRESREAAPEAEAVRIPSPEEIRLDTLPELEAQWESNNRLFLAALQKTPPPYFHLHGAPPWNTEKIRNEKGGFLQTTTFIAKGPPERLLANLFQMASYSSSYARPPWTAGKTSSMPTDWATRSEEPGDVILLADSEADELEDAGCPPTESEAMHPRDLRGEPVYGDEARSTGVQRKSVMLNPVNYDRVVRGIYPAARLMNFSQQFLDEDKDKFARIQIQDLFRAQDIVAFCLKEMHVL